MPARSPGAFSPLVSVVMPAWNAAHTLEATLQSLLDQRPAPGAPLPDFEIVVINDGSTDNTRARLERWSAEDRAGARLRALHLPHAGIALALNAGLNAARGAFIARMDADDTAHPERLARQAAHLYASPSLTLSAYGNTGQAHGPARGSTPRP